MSQKGVYPYDHMDSFEKFDQMELPTKDQFYSVLNDQHITDDEYGHAKKVWKTFKIKTMGEFHDLYLGSDVHRCINRCIGELQKDMLTIPQIRSMPLLHKSGS